ncbi:MAG: radical SAM protein [Candidatus Aegiribacteria sp.]|nr:radical SAM protein [Candidatus Aegiribacteria sp.]
MKIVLVYPSYGEGSHSRYFPFGLAYVAACLLEAGHSVSVVDMEGDNLSVTDAVRQTVDLSPRVVAFGGMVTRFRFVKQLSNAIRQKLPNVFMLAGNSGATTVPEIYLKSCGLNCVVLGEGEITLVELMKTLEEGSDWHFVPGIAWLDDKGELKKSLHREMIQDLDSIPWPAWDLFPVENYVSSLDHRQKKVRHMEVLASRGCPFSCVYCYRIYGRKVRRRSPESIVAELKELVRRYDIRYSGFPDDLFTSDRDFVMKICALVKEELPGLKWSCLGRVNTVDREMLLSMKDAGCDWISYGIESGCDDMLKRMRRGVTAEQCLEAIKLTESAGIHADGSFIIGMFGETRDSVGRTVEFCRQADITAPMLFVTPYPGTAIFNTALEQGRIPDVEKFLEEMNSADSLLVNLTDFTDRELMNLRDWAQGTIGRNYLLKKPFSRIPALLLKHYKLKGFIGLVHDARAFLASLLRRE